MQPPLSWAYAAVDPKYRQNIAQAKQLLDAAGWKVAPDGIRVKDRRTFSFTLYTNSSDPIRESYANLLRDAWAKVGVNVTVTAEKWSTFVDRVTRTHDFDAFVASFVGAVDPDLSALFSIDAAKSGLNAGRYLNTDVDSMLSKARSIYKPEQQQERKDLYTEDSAARDDRPAHPAARLLEECRRRPRPRQGLRRLRQRPRYALPRPRLYLGSGIVTEY